MKTIISILLLLSLLTIKGHAQGEDRIYHLINNKRDTRLMLDVARYTDTYIRAQDLTVDFALQDECDCDGESIAGAESFDQLMLMLADNYSYDWIHFSPDARWVSIAVVQSGGMYYGVVRVWL